MNIEQIQEKIERLEFQIAREEEKLSEMRFEAELLRVRLSEATVKWGTAAEQDLLTHPRFNGLLARLVKAMAD